FRFRYSQPKEGVTGSCEPSTRVRLASAGKGISEVPGRGGETGSVLGVSGFSSSSKITICSWPSGYQAGRTPAVAGQVNAPWLNFEAGQERMLVPRLKIPPLMKRTAKFVDRGSRLSAAFHATYRP